MATAPLVRALSCPSCGGVIESHLGAWSTTIICPRCGSTLDARSEPLQILVAADQAGLRAPSIPLGSRGVFDGDPFEAVGWQERQIVVDAETYRWREFVLFNPYLGFRYLSEYDGHWNIIRPIEGALPTAVSDGITYAGATFRHFQNASATTVRILGEFPWEAQRGDVVSTSDYVAPPLMIGSEDEAEGTTWSIGTYLEPAELTKAFDGTALELPPRHGVFANQPSPWASLSGKLWRIGIEAGVVLFLLCGALLAFRQNKEVFRSTYQFVRGADAPVTEEPAFVTPVFQLTGRGNVRLQMRATLDNAWLGAAVSLIDADRGTAYDTGLEVGRYSGVDGGESWSEGSYDARFRIPAVPSGNYYLRVAPEGAVSAEYTVSVRRDTPVAWYLLPAILALLIPPVIASIASASFEHRRWMESDHPPVTSSDEDDDDE
jgi:predicted RNA-binding Zn-ribbon protein involved in translation (DUF1610 family)